LIENEKKEIFWCAKAMVKRKTLSARVKIEREKL
jgi:hypothetical protein